LVVLGQQLHLLQINLTQKSVDIYSLNQIGDLSIQLLVLGFKILISFNQRRVFLKLRRQILSCPLVSLLKLALLYLSPDDVIFVLSSACRHGRCVLFDKLHLLLVADLGVKHILSFCFFFFKLLAKCGS
jgi:hypothetical protein